jgi:hypothetical protein
MTPNELVKKWIENRLDYATIAALRAAGETWEALSGKLDISITQARRILLSDGEGERVTKEDVKLLEKYLKLWDQLEGEKGLNIPLPTEDDIELVDRLTTALDEAKEASKNVKVPK